MEFSHIECTTHILTHINMNQQQRQTCEQNKVNKQSKARRKANKQGRESESARREEKRTVPSHPNRALVSIHPHGMNE